MTSRSQLACLIYQNDPFNSSRQKCLLELCNAINNDSAETYMRAATSTAWISVQPCESTLKVQILSLATALIHTGPNPTWAQLFHLRPQIMDCVLS